jgi:hypothetical protein
LQKTNLDLQQQFYGISCLKLLENCTYMENIQLKLWFSGTFVPLFGSKILKKCCCKWQVVFCNLSPLYEHLCGNRVGRVDLIFLWQFIVAQFWKLSSPMCNGIKKIKCAHMKCHTNVNYSPPTLLPHTSSYIAATPIDNHFDHPI